MKKGQVKEIEILKESLINKKTVKYSLECDLRRYNKDILAIEKELEWCENNYQ